MLTRASDWSGEREGTMDFSGKEFDFSSEHFALTVTHLAPEPHKIFNPKQVVLSY